MNQLPSKEELESRGAAAKRMFGSALRIQEVFAELEAAKSELLSSALRLANDVSDHKISNDSYIQMFRKARDRYEPIAQSVGLAIRTIIIDTERAFPRS